MSSFIKKKNIVVKGIFNKKTNKDYFEALQKARETKEYKQNEEQIKCIKKVLIERAEVPEKLIDWLIESVQENISLEHEFFKNLS